MKVLCLGTSTSDDQGNSESMEEVDETTSLLVTSTKSKPIGFLRALLLPGVITVSGHKHNMCYHVNVTRDYCNILLFHSSVF